MHYLLIATLMWLGGTADDIAVLDKSIKALAEVPPTVGRLGVLRALTAAQDRWEQRRTLADKLPPGEMTPPAPIRLADLEKRLQEAVKALQVRVENTGPALGIVPAVETELRKLGYTPKNAADADVLLRATTELGTADFDGTLYKVDAIITFELVEVSRNRVFKRFREMYRYGGHDEDAAHQRAVEELAKRVDGNAAARIDRAIRGRPDQAPQPQ